MVAVLETSLLLIIREEYLDQEKDSLTAIPYWHYSKDLP